MNKLFKGILQVTALPQNPENGVLYFVGDGTKGGNGTKVYFGGRCYGEVSTPELSRLEELISGNTQSIDSINKTLGEWTENLGTVASAVVANKTAIEVLNGNDATEGSVSHAVSTAKSELLGDAAEDYNTLGKLEDRIIEVKDLVTNKNIEATGDDYVSATTSGNTVIISATEATKASLSLADSALQKDDIKEGSTNGTISVGGDDVAVKGLGSAAYTESSAYATAEQGTTADEAKSAVDVLNGGVETAGSVAKSVADAKNELLGEVSETDAKTIAALNDKIESVESAAKTYAISGVTVSGEENVLEAYALYDEDGVQAGETIKIYKDQSLKNVELSGQTLVFTYELPDGNKTVSVDVSAFLSESEFKNGLQVVDHVVSVKLDETSESFLTVGADGVKLSGVQTAINDAVKDLNDASHTHDNKDVLDGITSEKVGNWDNAEENAKNHTDALLGSGITTGSTVTSILDDIKSRLSGVTNSYVKTVTASEGENAVDVVTTEGNVTISVKVSNAEGNMLTKDDEGLYVAMYYGGDDVDE